ncbi:endo-1,4-beta-xylanase [Actinomadura sp. ATCC 31491]|uniref:Beta-xylanase n=1 Tax=Actinomadura luzonensis TaxID=2805427 RepID=A0ABT0FP04_9ACTN|nr:endo-1,4-beta-xylanase [Actinomadura luzonensis]MCK2214088.1 endo-1,4-beta-xylanase [Actinomadura luzonensis]
MKPLILAMALVLAVPLPAQAHPRQPRDLRELAQQTGIRIGTAVDVASLRDEADYRKVLNREFSHVTAENAMKWESVEPERGTYTWQDADAVVANALRHDQKIRGHNLVWHNQLPAWLTTGVENGTIGDAELRDILRDHIMTEARRYRGKIRAWDVVNEVVDDDGNLRQSIWLTHLGPGYIADAFRWAHRADPHAKLYLNDYNIEWNTAKIETTYTLIKDLKAQGVPIHGIGFQGHLGIQYDYPGDWPAVMRRFADLGLEVAVTEMDVRMVLPVTPEKLATQADYYRRALSGCLSVSACREFTVWGFTDRHSWVPGWFDGEGAACLFDENYAPKPAYQALLSVKRG